MVMASAVNMSVQLNIKVGEGTAQTSIAYSFSDDQKALDYLISIRETADLKGIPLSYSFGGK